MSHRRSRIPGLVILLLPFLTGPVTAVGQTSSIRTVAELPTFPEGVAVAPDGRLFVSAFSHDTQIYEVDLNLSVRIVVGTAFRTGDIDGEGGDPRDDLGDGGPARNATIRTAYDVAVDPAGNLHIADTYNHRVRRVDAATGIISTIAGTGVPTGSIDGPGGNPLDDRGDGGPSFLASVAGPMRLVFDAAGNLYFTERESGRVRRVDAITGTITTVAGGGSSPNCPFDGQPALEACLGIPIGVALDSHGNIFVAERAGRVRRIDAATGIVSTVAGRIFSGTNHSDCGSATGVNLRVLGDVAVDSAGNLYLTEESGAPGDMEGAHKIRRVDHATGIITTVAGTGVPTGSLDGEGGVPADDLGDGEPSTAASLAWPSGLTFGPDGVLYVADRNNFRVRAIRLGPDVTPDELGLGLTPAALWPPDHRLVAIQARPSRGACQPAASWVLESVVSNEDDDLAGPGDGQTHGDIQGADTGTSDMEFSLRAERAATGPGRDYTVTYRVAGSIEVVQALVMVPHDRHGLVDPVQIQVVDGANTWVFWEPVEGALWYDVVRGALSALRDAGDSYTLGNLRCIEARSTEPSTHDQPDADVPEPGHGFFYLVSFPTDGALSFGSEQAAKPRLVDSGSCP
jgi:sugar lactone lactonase YvrE